MKAAELLDHLMDPENPGGSRPRRQCIVVGPTGVVTRGSTDTNAIDDPFDCCGCGLHSAARK